MSEPEKLSALPDARSFLDGKDGVKPHHHKAETLQQFAAGFEELPLAPKASETMVQLGDVMKKPHWAGAHDAAHQALVDTKKLVAEGSELASHAYTVESIFNARAPSAQTVKGITHPTLQGSLKPLTTYLEEFGSFVTGWVGLTPSRMKPKGEEAITPALHRIKTQAAINSLKISNPDVVIPECGDVGCTIDHKAELPKRKSLTILPEPPADTGGHVHDASCKHDHPPAPPSPSSSGGHVHGPGCGHDHAPSSGSSSGGGTHYHGDTPCSHSHPHAPGGGAHEPHLPKGKSNAAHWVAAIAGVVGVGAYLINEYGKSDTKKPKKKEDTTTALPQTTRWQERVNENPVAMQEGRVL